MDRHLKKAGLLVGVLFLGWAAQAQAQTTNTLPTDSTRHRYGMHHGWADRNDSTHRGFGPRRGFGGEGWANRGPEGFNRGPEGFHRNPDGFHRGSQAFRGHNRHGEGIHYTPDQRKQRMAINKEYRQKQADLFKQDDITLKQYKAGLVALQKEKKEKMAALLTPQQKDQLAARKKRMEENRQVAQAAHLERLKLRLDLSEDQVARIKAGQENLHNQVKAIHDNDDLLPQQKREQLKALLAKRNDTYKSVLSPEQYTQFEKMHERGFGRPRGFGRVGFGRVGFEHNVGFGRTETI